MSFLFILNTAKAFSLFILFQGTRVLKKKVKEGDFSVYSASHLD